MNIIDKNFYNLTKEIKNKSLEEIYNEIRNYYINIPLEIQNSLEDFFNNFNYLGKLKKMRVYMKNYIIGLLL